MKTPLPLLCLMALALAISGEVCKPRPKCRNEGGKCQPIADECEGTLHRGRAYCRPNNVKCGCCVPTKVVTTSAPDTSVECESPCADDEYCSQPNICKLKEVICDEDMYTKYVTPCITTHLTDCVGSSHSSLECAAKIANCVTDQKQVKYADLLKSGFCLPQPLCNQPIIPCWHANDTSKQAERNLIDKIIENLSDANFVANPENTCGCHYKGPFHFGCVIRQSAPKKKACRCSQYFFTCSGEVVSCQDPEGPHCNEPDTSIESCRQGQGDCNGY